ncbi:MAG TPA: DUF1634 domain-containing protein [Bryobacteraceae bacterium]|nr:DUF1634 domain-containing protein [Bryobacteraceae bacterium]
MTDRRIEEIIGTLLRAGVLLSAAIVLTGGIWYMARHGEQAPSYYRFLGEPLELRGLPALIGSLGALRARTLIQLGLIILIATPVARVVFSLIAFWLERDRTYVVITLIVLAILLYSLMVY